MGTKMGKKKKKNVGSKFLFIVSCKDDQFFILNASLVLLECNLNFFV